MIQTRAIRETLHDAAYGIGHIEEQIQQQNSSTELRLKDMQKHTDTKFEKLQESMQERFNDIAEKHDQSLCNLYAGLVQSGVFTHVLEMSNTRGMHADSTISKHELTYLLFRYHELLSPSS